MRSFRPTAVLLGALFAAGCGGDSGPANQSPTATFAAPSCNVLSCTFTDGSSDPDGTIASREWTFESGTPATSTEANPVVTFAAAGTPYTVTLTVTDNEGASDDFTLEVTVTGNAAPVAGFTFECAAFDCTFTNTSADVDGTFTSLWDFGDGETSTETSPSHSYAFTAQQDVTVSLTVTDDDGAPDEVSQTFTVSPPADLTCADGTPDCELDIQADARVEVTLVSSDCELSGNTFKVIITPPGGGTPVEETLFTDGCNTPDGTSFQLQSNAVFAAGTVITAQVISGGAVLELPPAVRLTPTSAYPSWTLEFDDGAQAEPPEPDYNDLVITVVATPE